MLIGIFKEVLNLSLSGAVAAIIIMLVKLFAGRKLHIRFHYILWLLLIIKLVLPINIQSTLSLFNYVSPADNLTVQHTAENTIVQENKYNSVTDAIPTRPYTNNKEENLVTDQIIEGTDLTTVDMWKIAAYIWLIGIIIMVSIIMVSYMKTAKILKQQVTNYDNRIKVLIGECKRELDIRRNISVICTQSFSAPFVYGFFKPMIVIPQNLFNIMRDDQIRSVLLHEMVHIKRYDPLMRFLMLCLQAIHWFNPIIWFSFSWLAKDCECACDAAVIKDYDHDKRVSYASALYSLAENNRRNLLPLLGFGESNIKKRIKDVLKRRRYSIFSIIAAVLIIIVLAVSLLTKAASNEDEVSLQIYLLNDETTEKSLLFTHEDIISYDWEQQSIRIKNNGKITNELLKRNVEFVVNDETIYSATLWSPIFSQMPPKIPIYADDALFIGNNDEIVLMLGRYMHLEEIPESVRKIITDDRIYKVLKNLGIPLESNLTTEDTSIPAVNPMDDELTVKPDEDIKERVEFLLNRIVNNESLSSNPYDYMSNNKDIEELIALGEPAMYSMFDIFAKNHEDGLKEYVMMVACAEILGVNENHGVYSSKEWFYKFGQFGLDELHQVDADYEIFPIDIDNKEEISLPEGTDKTKIDEVISNYILARNRRAFYQGEKALEAHHIYRSEENDGIVNVYMLVRFAWFEFQNDVFTSVSGTGGIPVRMELKLNETNQYEVISYEEPMDGGGWLSSLQEMFPDDLVEKVTTQDSRIKLEDELLNILTEKAAAYLMSVNRGNTPLIYKSVPELIDDDDIRDAINQVIGMRRSFPEWIGSREILINVGGKYPGAKVRCFMETDISSNADGEYIVTLTRTWDAEINGVKPISVWKYSVLGNHVTLIEEQNKDYMMTLIK